MTDDQLRTLIGVILDGYALNPLGVHGIAHWARVLENGRSIAAVTGADVEVVELFALFHDSRRINETYDPGHGGRGGQLARELCGSAFRIDAQRLDLLTTACDGHTDLRSHSDVTIATCWDADRLDLGRCSTEPEPSRLAILFDRVDETTSTNLVRTAHGRAAFHVAPDWVASLLEDTDQSS